MIIRQIIPLQYKMIRYFGAYSKNHKASKKVAKLISKYISMCRKKKTKYRELIMSSFNRDPLKCPKCNKDLVFLHRFLN